MEKQIMKNNRKRKLFFCKIDSFDKCLLRKGLQGCRSARGWKNGNNKERRWKVARVQIIIVKYTVYSMSLDGRGKAGSARTYLPYKGIFLLRNYSLLCI
jgi:hypothetical protein